MSAAGAALVAAAALLAQAPPASAQPVSVDRTIAALGQRLFPILSTLADARWTAALAADARYAATMRARGGRSAACGEDPVCRMQAQVWTPDDTAALLAAVDARGRSASLPALPANADLGRADALTREVEALDSVLAVYGRGIAPRYPAIDGPVFATGTKQAADDIKIALDIQRATGPAPAEAVGGSLTLALTLLDINGRDDAVAFDPLDARENDGARRVATGVRWGDYRYTALIVPGVGPEDEGTRLSPRGKLHALLAAARFRAGLAPFILVSGSAVHPRGTHVVEAVELRRMLVERLGIPAERIILEPYARHTTTNLRNATRRLAALGVPLDRPALIVTDIEQSRYIEGPVFAQRNAAELGYQPGAVGRRLSDFDLEFLPSRSSLRQDARDPLDP